LNARWASGFIDTRVLAESEARCQVMLSLVRHGIQAHCKKSVSQIVWYFGSSMTVTANQKRFANKEID
jgi:hypothetical protein